MRIGSKVYGRKVRSYCSLNNDANDLVRIQNGANHFWEINLYLANYRKGIIQLTKKKAGKSNSNIYGLLTDGTEYQFSRIKNQSKVL